MTLLPTLMRRWWIACWPRPPTASTAPATGSTRPAMPTPTGSTSTITARCGPIATGSSTPSTATCRSISSRLEQLAGDLLPNRTLDQQVASGFNRCNITTNEGGTIAEENLVGYTRDRTETTARVFLGLTANCAVCHDHKFDPITQRDFYSMSAFFNNITMDALDGNVQNTPPVVKVPRLEDRPRWERAGRGDRRRRRSSSTIAGWRPGRNLIGGWRRPIPTRSRSRFRRPT